MTLAHLKTLVQTVQGMGWQAALRAIRYNKTAQAMNRRYARTHSDSRMHRPGAVSAVDRSACGVLLHTERARIEIHFLTGEIARVRLHPNSGDDGKNLRPPFSYAVEREDWPSHEIQTQDGLAAVVIQAEVLACRIDKDACRLTFFTSEGHTLSEDAGGLSWGDGGAVRWTRVLPDDESGHGLGQRPAGLNLRGRRWSLWNADPLPGYERDADPVYSSIPFYLGVRENVAFGVLWDNPARGAVDLGAQRADAMTFSAEDGELRFYVFAGPTVGDVLRQYTSLTGHMPLPPLWALGFHQSRWGYESEDEFRALADEFRRRHLPCDVLYYDIDYMDGCRVFTWDRARFPLMPGLLADLSAQGFKSVAIVDPGIKSEANFPIYDEGLRADVFLKYPDGKPVVGPVWPGNSVFPDFTSARVRAWWAEHVTTLAQAGFAGLWNDMNEPTIITYQRGTTLADSVLHDWDGLGATHAGGGHNVYGTLMARATREGLQKARPDKRPFVMTRAAYAGAQRYTSSWTGDNIATWDHLRLSLQMTLQAGLSGFPFTGPDVGGFVGEPDAELYARWFQLGSLLPYFRVHSAKDTGRREPWQFGEQVEAIARHALELRYQLLPYLYSTFARCTQDGMPIVRPLFMADPTDPALRDLDDAFMLGDSILVAPVFEAGATQRELVLPRGVWYEFDTGKLIDGARTVTVSAPLDRLPIYVRAGKTLPMWPVIQYVGERPPDEGRLRVYAGSGETSFYEDAGEGLAYQNGDYRWSYFTCQFLPSGQFAIDWRRAGHYQPPYTQMRVEVVGISGEPERVMLDGQAAPIWYYERGVVEFFVLQPFSEARIVGRASHAQETRLRRPKT